MTRGDGGAENIYNGCRSNAAAEASYDVFSCLVCACPINCRSIQLNLDIFVVFKTCDSCYRYLSNWLDDVLRVCVCAIEGAGVL